MSTNRFRARLGAWAAAIAMLAAAVPAMAGNTIFLTDKNGNITFPFSPPNRANSTPGFIDNMTIGSTTPAPGTFTALNSSSQGCNATPCITQGLNAAQGGIIRDIGGTSSTSANAGGAAQLIGGVPGATGVGGAASIAGGAGGLTSGAGGAASVTGGVGTAGNSAGGAAQLIGGAGQGSAAGGAVTITGGAGGATGVGGAVAITAGSPTAGAGSSVTITASAGAGGTNGGGVVNLVPGAAVSTGAPGVVQVNGNPGLICHAVSPAASPSTGSTIFIATRPMLIEQISAVYSTAAGAAGTIGVYHDTGTGTPGSGTDMLSANFNINTTINTVQAGTLTGTVATLTLAAGDRVSLVLASGSYGSTAGLNVTFCAAPQ